MDIQLAPRVASAVGSHTKIFPNKPDYILRRWGDPFLLNGDLRIPTISVFIDFLETIGPDRGIFISGFMGDTVTGDISHVSEMDTLETPENFFALADLAPMMKMQGWQELAYQIPNKLKRIRDEFTGSDFTKDLMLNLVTRQRRYFSFQERLIEYYGGLIVPFEDVKVLEYFFQLPFMATENQELYKRFQARFFPALAAIATVKQGAWLPATKDVVWSSLQRDFKYLNAKYFRNLLKIPSVLMKSGSAYAVDHASAIRYDSTKLSDMINRERETLGKIVDMAKVQGLIDLHMQGSDGVSNKVLAVLLILSGLQACRNGS
ncbi:MAG: hypothetical protein HY758_09455 [Nitrospirae bacterium]|nr:hypothetical protein [Nitrospirota bacterium]